MGPDRFDVAVVGAGLTGAATARELTARGHSVLLLEQYAVGHDRGSSHGSSRIYRRACAEALYVTLTGRASEEWDRLEEESGVTLRTQTGGLDAGAGRCQLMLASLLRQGVEASLLSPAAVAEQWPGIALDGDACFHADAGHLNADPDPLAEKSCLFTMTSDEDFVLDRAASRGGQVVIASPCSSHGAKFAPLVGVVVADLVEGAAPHPRFAFRNPDAAGSRA